MHEFTFDTAEEFKINEKLKYYKVTNFRGTSVKATQKDIFMPGKYFILPTEENLWHLISEQTTQYELIKDHVPDLKIFVLNMYNYRLGPEPMNIEDFCFEEAKRDSFKNLAYFKDFASAFVDSPTVYHINGNNYILEEVYLIFDLRSMFKFNLFEKHGLYPYWMQVEYQRDDGSIQYKHYPWTGLDDTQSVWQRDGLIKTRERFLKIAEKDESFPKKIYISRSDATKKWLTGTHDKKIYIRAYTKEPKLKEYFLSKGYVEVVLSEYSYKNQLKFFYNATHVVGLCGTGLVNSFICQEGTQVIEILANGKYQFSYRYMTQIAPIKFETIDLRRDPSITADIDARAIEKLEGYNWAY